MIRSRSVGLAIVLSIITCGIYGIYWYVSMANDLNTASDNPSGTSGVAVWLLTIVTCGIYGLYWMYKAGEKLNKAKALRNMPADSNSGIVYLILSIFGLGIVSYALIQSELNKMAA